MLLDDEQFLTKDVLDAMPIFPLPNVVLLPGTVLPLNVFEPRYLELVDHVLSEGRVMGIPLLRPGYASEYHGRPEIEPVFGIGTLLSHQRLSDGRRFIRVEGMRRARLRRELPPRHAFREVMVELLHEVAPGDTMQLAVLEAQLERIATYLRPDDHRLVDSLLSIPDPRVRVYAIATIMSTFGLSIPSSPSQLSQVLVQQRCLEQEDADERVAGLLEIAAVILDELHQAGRAPSSMLN